MKGSFLFFVGCLFWVCSGWQCPELNRYYDKPTLIDGCNGSLKTELNKILAKDSNSISYTDVWNAFWDTDTMWNLWECNSLNDLYSTKCWQNDTLQCGNYKTEGDCYNREHSWPKSWWGGDKNAAYTDLHHLYPADGYDNGRRGNYPFGIIEPSSVKYTTNDGGKLGTCNSDMGDAAGTTCFEPTDQSKGILARGYFYMSVRYMDVFDCCDTLATDGANIKSWQEDMLRDWHKQFPVTQAERDRDQVIYEDYQYNHNPFVVCPWLVDLVCDF